MNRRAVLYASGPVDENGDARRTTDRVIHIHQAGDVVEIEVEEPNGPRLCRRWTPTPELADVLEAIFHSPVSDPAIVG